MTGDHRPRFTVIIPTYSRYQQLISCLDSLASLRYPADRCEAIVVIDGGLLEESEVRAVWQNCFPLQVVSQPRAGPAAARNTGAWIAGGEYLAFTDDDCRISAGWLEAIAKRLGDHPAYAVGGRTVNVLTNNPYAAATHFLTSYMLQYHNTDPEDATFFSSNNLVFPAEGFREIGGFDASFSLPAGEDRELCDRWIRFGNKIAYAPEAVVYHAHLLDFTSFCLQHYYYGQGAYLYRKRQAHKADDELRLEPLRFYARLLSSPLSAPSTVNRLLLFMLIVLTQAANTGGFLRGWLRMRLRACRGL